MKLYAQAAPFKRHQSGAGVSKEKRLRIYQRDAWTCVYCGKGSSPEMAWKELHLDHKLPRTRGGSNADENLATACVWCNTSKHNKTYDEWMMRRCEHLEDEETRL